METMKNYLIFSTVLVMAFACQPEPDDLKLYDELVVQTNYDPSASFATYKTYSIATDTIGFLSNQTNDTILTNANNDLVRPIIAQIKQNLNQRGYTEVQVQEAPDIGIKAVIAHNYNLFQQVVDPGYYYPYYYGYSSYYYYPYVQTYSENTATLVLQAIDLKNRNSSNQVKVVWTAYLGDLITSVKQLEQTTKGIDQAFVQSPYFQSN